MSKATKVSGKKKKAVGKEKVSPPPAKSAKRK